MSNKFQLLNATALKGFFVHWCLDVWLYIYMFRKPASNYLAMRETLPYKKTGRAYIWSWKALFFMWDSLSTDVQIYFGSPFTSNVRKEKLTCQLGGPVCLVISPTLIFYISPGSLGSSAHPRGPKNHGLETEWKVARCNKQLYFYTKPRPAAEDHIITAVQNSVDHLKCGRGVHCS